MSSHEHRKRSRSPEDRSRRDRERGDRDRDRDATSRHASSRHSTSNHKDEHNTRSSRSSGHRDHRDREKDRDRSSRHDRDRERDKPHSRDHRHKRSRRDKESASDSDRDSGSEKDQDDGGSSSSDEDDDDEIKGKNSEKEKVQLSRKAESKGATTPITMDDYFLKSTEFRLWLRKSKKKYFDKLSSSKSHEYFRKFVKAWNSGDLDDTYYKGVRSAELASQGTKYKWGFVQKMGAKDQDELERTKDSIDSLTNSAKRFAEEMNTSSSASKRFHDPTTAPSGSSMSYTRRTNNADDVYEREEHGRQQRLAQRAQDRSYRKSREADLEELVPKATGREALLEKRKAQTEYHRRERSPGVELSDHVMMGGGDDFKSALAADRRARQQREERQQMRREGRSGDGGSVLDARKQAFQEKEQGKIEALRQLWMQSQAAKRD